ncbi:MAG: PAS domain S-box protein [Bacteroidales bacterium]|nr:PAS domain S-box protein [Bacteroidales bacterium]
MESTKMLRPGVLMIFLSCLISLMVAYGGYAFYKIQKKKTEIEKYTELKAIADLKANQIVQWYNERISELLYFSRNDEFAGLIASFHNGNKDKSFNFFDKNFSLFASNHEYENIFILTPDSKIIYNLNPGKTTDYSRFSDYMDEVIFDNQLVYADLNYCNIHQKVHFDFLAQVQYNNKQAGVMVFRVDPEIYLYPLIQSWPTPAKTSETLLVRPDGDSILFLNELRFLKNTALRLRFPRTNISLPALQAIEGKTGFFEGKDYRDVEVIADLQKISGTSWFMIAKIDKSEVFAELKNKAVFITIISIITILLVVTITAWSYHYRQKKIYIQLFKSQSDLQQSQAEFRTMLYSIGDGVLTTDRTGKVQFLNPVAERLTGWKEHEAKNKALQDVFNIINEESRIKVRGEGLKEIGKNFTGGLSNHILINRKGEKTPITTNGAPIKNIKGEIIGVVLVFRDQTKERAGQLALKDSEQRFRSVFESSSIGKSMTSMDGSLITNKAFSSMLGYTHDEFLAKNWKEITHPEDIKQSMDIAQSLIGGRNKSIDFEKRYIHKNGNVVWTRVNTALQRDDSGNPLFFITSVIDITDRKRTEEQLFQERDRMIKLAATAPGVLCSFRMYPDGRQQMPYTSPLVFNVLGFTPEELSQDSSHLLQRIHQEDAEHVAESIFESARTLLAWRCEYRYNHPIKGEIWVEGHTVPTRETDGSTIWHGFITDITERKLIEEKIRKLNTYLENNIKQRTAQLYASNKELEAFAYSVSHDLRTPLRGIHGFTRILSEDYADKLDDEGKRICSVIMDSTIRMGELIDHLLEYSRLNRLELSKTFINMNAMVKTIYREITDKTSREKISFKIEELSPVYGDKNMIRQVWENLLSNAVKYSSKKDSPEIIISCQTEDNRYVYSVKDNGAGFDMKYVDKLFGVFQRLHHDKEFKGIGVGLAIVQRIIHRHDGEIWAEGEKNKGAVFYFSLPKIKP